MNYCIDQTIKVDHIGYAVSDMERAQAIFHKMGYEFNDVIPDEARNVNVSVGLLGGVKVELLEPLPGKRTPIDGYINKIGSTPYHICYEVECMEESIIALQQMGFTLIGSPAPSLPLGGDVCFLYSLEVGMIELICYQSF